MNKNNVIITGVPRSGTTLACYLLNKVPNMLALHEPMEVAEFAKLSDDQICKKINDFFFQNRKSLLENKTVISRHVGGKIPSNIVGLSLSQQIRAFPKQFIGSFMGLKLNPKRKLRKAIAVSGEIRIDKELSPDFILCLKHPAAFSAKLDILMNHFPSYAIIRNPLSVLASWNTVKFMWDGHSLIAESLDISLANTLSRINDRIERQLYLLSWFFEKYYSILPVEHIIKYENIVYSGGRALQIIAEQACTLNEALDSKNKNKVYDKEFVISVGERLLNTSGAYWEFYKKESVEMLLQEFEEKNS
ncbi:hypothetical protein [Nitrosococcus wardiae]|uniref:Sulfotransferase n=1 Tax=Nitrosococcus wardiae TaxID=1814290 RepID=A0A4P7BYX9_9GAMM|nr:hypothetical protein [Nitrosococcus wardiae]QBQ54390.1 hypothetical protein E3U44_07600 [Nitrosococcus wardiae]